MAIRVGRYFFSVEDQLFLVQKKVRWRKDLKEIKRIPCHDIQMVKFNGSLSNSNGFNVLGLIIGFIIESLIMPNGLFSSSLSGFRSYLAFHYVVNGDEAIFSVDTRISKTKLNSLKKLIQSQ